MSLILPGPGDSQYSDDIVVEHDVTEFESFWSSATSSMLVVVASVALCKVGITMAGCQYKGYPYSIGMLFGILPHLAARIEPGVFTQLVELSTWLGVLGLIIGILLVERRRDLDDSGDPAALDGMTTGILVASLAVPVNAWFELIRSSFFDNYPITMPQIVVAVAAIVPIGALALGYGRRTEILTHQTQQSQPQKAIHHD